MFFSFFSFFNFFALPSSFKERKKEIIVAAYLYGIVILLWRKFICEKSASGMLINPPIVFTFTRQRCEDQIYALPTSFILQQNIYLLYTMRRATRTMYVIFYFQSSTHSLILGTINTLIISREGVRAPPTVDRLPCFI